MSCVSLNFSEYIEQLCFEHDICEFLEFKGAYAYFLLPIYGASYIFILEAEKKTLSPSIIHWITKGTCMN